MPVRIVRLGTPRAPGEGIRIGTVRRPPRGVGREDFARLDYYDVWLPQLSPSAELVSFAQHEVRDEKGWKRFERKFRAEISATGAARVLDLLVALSHTTDFSVGCYCEDESRCHRAILRELFRERGATLI